jgi:PHP family Zn ribbon phosphoesterase
MYNASLMGNIERQRIVKTKDFVEQLDLGQIPLGCLQASLLAMGGEDIHFHEAVDLYEKMIGIPNIDAYIKNKGLKLSTSLHVTKPLSISHGRKMLQNPKTIAVERDYKSNLSSRIVGLLFAFGEYDKEPPHIVGVLPRGDMTRNLRKILKAEDAHVVVDTSQPTKSVYLMATKSIVQNLNAFILNDIPVSLHIVARSNQIGI